MCQIRQGEAGNDGNGGDGGPGVLISPEATAASPMISPATMLTAPPTALGSRRPASCMISYTSSTPIASAVREMGAFSSASARISSRGAVQQFGVVQGNRQYNAGSSTATRKAAYLIQRISVA